MSGEEVLIPITLFGGAFAMTFGIVYLKTRENLAMLEKGFNPKIQANRPAPYRNLKWGLLLIGAGIGLLVAHVLDNYVFLKTENEAIYFALVGIGGGLGLISSYKVEKRELLDRPQI
ncbi:MAG TPA: DUF6249 domain-containing protein [Flavitalea sp.]|nr:DUF6249 domain-containing protein [Flavitalea sp.]